MMMRSNRNRVNNTSDMWSWAMTDIYMSVKSLLASLEITCSMEVTLRLLDMEVTLRLLDGPHLSLKLCHVGHLEELLGPVLGGDGLERDRGQ